MMQSVVTVGNSDDFCNIMNALHTSIDNTTYDPSPVVFYVGWYVGNTCVWYNL